MTKKLKIKAWAVVGRHHNVYVTDVSDHFACEGRLQIYLESKHAVQNAHSLDDVIPVLITEIIPKKKKRV